MNVRVRVFYALYLIGLRATGHAENWYISHFTFHMHIFTNSIGSYHVCAYAYFMFRLSFFSLSLCCTFFLFLAHEPKIKMIKIKFQEIQALHRQMCTHNTCLDLIAGYRWNKHCFMYVMLQINMSEKSNIKWRWSLCVLVDNCVGVCVCVNFGTVGCLFNFLPIRSSHCCRYMH